jgi:hypothetical protein
VAVELGTIGGMGMNEFYLTTAETFDSLENCWKGHPLKWVERDADSENVAIMERRFIQLAEFLADARTHWGIAERIDLSVVDGPVLNATALKIPGGQYHILLSASLFHLPRLFEKIVASTPFVEAFSLQETAISPEGRTQHGSAPAPPAILLLLDPQRPQVTDVQRSIYEILTFFAFRFLLFHELSHIGHGHLALLAARNSETANSLASIEETTRLSDDEDTNKTLQTFELDADMVGPAYQFGAIIANSEEETLPSLTPKQNLLLLFVSLYALLRFLEADPWTPEKFWTRNHPPAIFRLTCVSARLGDLCESIPDGRIVAAELERAMVEAIRLTERAFQYCSGYSPPEVRAVPVDFYNEMLKRWAAVHSSLEKLKPSKQKLAPVLSKNRAPSWRTYDRSGATTP